MIEVFEEIQGWAYRVEGVYQPYHPDKEGNIPMTKEQAEQCAAIVATRIL